MSGGGWCVFCEIVGCRWAGLGSAEGGVWGGGGVFGGWGGATWPNASLFWSMKTEALWPFIIDEAV